MAATVPPGAWRFRADIEGMRAVAVLLVLLYHVGLPGFGGGYVGVDVFFVLSGYLITGLLVGELRSTGAIQLRRFFARRVRRLLPISTMVALVTFLTARVVLTPLEVMELRGDAVATAVYLANVRFAQTGTDYLAAHSSASPFQHYWSLALEEQFYVVWPMLFVVTWLVAKRVDWDQTRTLLVTVTAVAACSFVLGILLTTQSQPLAFFLLPSRAWELAAGGILALVFERYRAGWVTSRSTLLVASGLALIAVSVLAFSGVEAFPGWLAVVPVVGTLLVLAGGEGRSVLHRPLESPLMQSIGKRSYSIYLWHWPLLVFADGTPDGELPMAARFVVLVAAVVMAFLSYRFVENPVRSAPFLAASPARNAVVGVLLTTVTLSAALVVTAAPDLTTGAIATRTAAIARPTAGPSAVPDNLEPPLIGVRADRPTTYLDGCHVGFPITAPPHECSYGDRGADQNVLLFGDSVAAHWFPALERVAREDGWLLRSRTKSACAPHDLTVLAPELGRDYHECDQWRANVLDEMEADPPDVVVLAGHYGGAAQDRADAAAWLAALERSLARIEADRVVVLGALPTAEDDVPACLSRNLRSVERCSTSAARVGELLDLDRKREVVERHGATFVDLRELLCDGDTCPPVFGDLLVYRDTVHLTTAFAEHLAPHARRWLGN